MHSSWTTQHIVSRNSPWRVEKFGSSAAEFAARLVSGGELRAWSAGDAGRLAAAWLLAVGGGVG